MNGNKDFQWEPSQEAEDFILQTLNSVVALNPQILNLQKDLAEKTNTRLMDWVDYLAIQGKSGLLNSVERLGFKPEFTHPKYRVYTHTGTCLPGIVISEDPHKVPAGPAVHVDRVSDFLMVRGINAPIEGSPFSGLRRAVLFPRNDVSLTVVERRGVRSIEPQSTPSDFINLYFEGTQLWMTRPRSGQNTEELMRLTLELAGKLTAMLGKDYACHVIFECERRYWLSRNYAGRVQKSRQDTLGMGWGNHDHHTFRSSRKHFPILLKTMETLGFQPREKYYAGKEAGWGAQVMENPNCRISLFLDVDMTPDEIDVDFYHDLLPETDTLGTVGLWCELHGESLLQAGLHHLAARLNFEEAIRDLKRFSIETMRPFSLFPYLKQAFTEGDRWTVGSDRLEKVTASGRISNAQGSKFSTMGALGSHLENIERNWGFKGFNQKNVSQIIKETDPRRNI